MATRTSSGRPASACSIRSKATARPIALTRPLIQTTSAVNAKGDKSGFTPWGFDETGVEWGINAGGTSLSATVFNGLIENAEDPAQGGKLKKAAGSPTQNNKDFQLFFNQFIGASDAAVAAYYYNGRISLGSSALYKDQFDRYGVYVTVPVNKLQLLGGYGWGKDDDDITDSSAKSKGWFLEADGYLKPTLGIGARYDQFDPSDKISNNDVKAFTAFVNLPMNNGLQMIGEFKNKKTEHGTGPSQTENSVNLRFIYIW